VPNSISAGVPPQTLLWELTVLPQIGLPKLDLSGLLPRGEKGREKEGIEEGRVPSTFFLRIFAHGITTQRRALHVM